MNKPLTTREALRAICEWEQKEREDQTYYAADPAGFLSAFQKLKPLAAAGRAALAHPESDAEPDRVRDALVSESAQISKLGTLLEPEGGCASKRSFQAVIRASFRAGYDAALAQKEGK